MPVRTLLLSVLVTACAEDPSKPTAPGTEPPPPSSPTTCTVDLSDGDLVPLDPACAASSPTVSEPWRVRLQDRLVDEVPRHTPVVGHLDADGVPEIVGVDRFGGSFGSALVVWEGDDGRVRFSLPDGFEAGVDPLIADLDGDGAGEIVVAAYSGWLHVELVALDGNGQERWRSSSLRLECLAVDGPCPLTAADVDGDGVAEVLVDGWLLDGASGATLATLPLDTWYGPSLRGAAIADLDRDGTVELVVGDEAYAPDGTRLWSVSNGTSRSAMPALAQLDAEADAEVVIARDRELLLLEADGTLIRRVDLPGAQDARAGYAGPPCVGDLDTDGASEIVVAGGTSLDAFEADGSVAWSQPMVGNDGTGGLLAGMLGCATFDFDGDGRDEVVFGDAMGLRILDGSTGQTLWSTVEYGGYTEMQGPVVADVDGDGAAEILASSTGHVLNIDSWSGVQIYEHDGAGWSPTGSVWGVHDFAGGNMTPAGGFPTTPAAPWAEGGRFRGNVVTGASAPAADLAVAVEDSCAVCDDGGEVRLAVSVRNEGGSADPEAVLRVSSGSGVLVEVPLGAVEAGRMLDGVEISLTPDQAREDLVVEVAGSVSGCDDTDDVEVVVAPCP